MPMEKITKIYHYDTIDSTNEQAKRLAREGAPHGTVVLADTQTKGKGRLERSFYSPADKGIYMSVIIRGGSSISGGEIDVLNMLAHSLGGLSVTSAAAVAVCRAIEKKCGVHCDIKWVNDVYLSGRKICGILSEAEAGTRGVEYIIVGIGVNCVGAVSDFPLELRERAGTLAETACASGDAGSSAALFTASGRESLACSIAEELLSCVAGEYSPAEMLAEYKERCFFIGEDIYIYRNARGGKGVGLDENGEPVWGVPARAIDVDPSGGLVVQYLDGNVGILTDGEVSVRCR